MGTTNSCECPDPPGGRVECDPRDAAVCYVTERGEVVRRCIRLNPKLQALIQRADETQLQQLVAEELNRELNIPFATLFRNSWIPQTLDDGIVYSVRLSDLSSLNVKLPGVWLSAAAAYAQHHSEV